MTTERRDARSDVARDVRGYVVVLFATSTVFFLVGPLVGSLSEVTRASVPGSALAVVCPTVAAVVVARRTGTGAGLAAWLTTPPRGTGYAVLAVVVMPVVVLGAAALGGAVGFAWPGPEALLLVVVFLIGALAEEVGWTALLLPRFLRVAGATASALAIGALWALWHVIPDVQAGHPPAWLVGHALATVMLRVVLVHLTVASGASVWLAVVGHAANNVAWALSPDMGAGYDVWMTGALTAVVAALLTAVAAGRARRGLRPRAADG
ncbi:CPBP family intramembrane glutamic endopeptidase [Georgenia faecalis]|uniref:CPBP family intramembrane glutamic endopeptidase n=1 Tax=Georgenia faecalis TaxID=2483799 RepID=A0ABV9D9C8_9MICO|nr:CPBP family intramembrane glutamic endopeptidase [Georgenia faecalis]